MAKQDPLIRKFGERLFAKHGDKPHLITFIAQKMRELSRLVIEARKDDSYNGCTLESLLTPRNFNKLKDFTKAVTKYDDETMVYGNPSLAMKLPASIKKCASIALSSAIKAEDSEQQDSLRKFLELHQEEFPIITQKAKQTLDNRKYNKPTLLPLFEDVVRVNKQIDEEIEACMKKDKTLNLYVSLAKLCLAGIIMFNRKRSGEAQRMKVTEYQSAKSNSECDGDLLQDLSEFEKKLVTTMTRVEIEGKRGRNVPILLTTSHRQALDFLLDLRESLDQEFSSDCFLFARPGNCLYPYRGHVVLKEVVSRAGVAKPELMTSVHLRKHLATMTQVLNIDVRDQDMLADFMGHDIRVHRSFYRMPLDIIEKAKVSQVLMAVNMGQGHTYQGKTLADIDVNTRSKYDFL